jgi:carbonic anhydrase
VQKEMTMTDRNACVISTALLALFLAACGGKSVEQSPEQAKAPAPSTHAVTPHAEDPHWGYEGAEGASKWDALSPKWAICGQGRSQSPIDIEKTVKADLPELRAEFKPATLKIIQREHTADVINTGHSIQVNDTGGDSLTIGDEQFELVQYHFHSPSEHTVAGKHYAAEMHMVHKSAGGKLAVVGAFIEEGKHNAAFDPIWSNLPKSKGEEHHLEHLKVDVDDLLPARTATYRYEGSLTTPPCSEGVKWIIMTTPIQLSADQIATFRSVMNGNSRPVQQLYGRSVATDNLKEVSGKPQ